MALVRCVTEMGMGVDVHGLDYWRPSAPFLMPFTTAVWGLPGWLTPPLTI